MDKPKESIYKQFLKFGIIGFANTIVDLAILNLLIFSTGLGKEGGLYFSIFKCVAFIFAATNSYIFNKLWVFKDKEKGKSVLKFSKFFLITIGGGIINIVTATLVVTYIPPVIVPLYLWPTFGALCGVATGMFWNFFGYKFVVFGEGAPKESK